MLSDAQKAKLAALKGGAVKPAKKVTSNLDLKAKKGDLSGLDGMLLSGMAETVGKLGMVSAASRGDWTTKVLTIGAVEIGVKVATNPDVSVDMVDLVSSAVGAARAAYSQVYSYQKVNPTAVSEALSLPGEKYNSDLTDLHRLALRVLLFSSFNSVTRTTPTGIPVEYVVSKAWVLPNVLLPWVALVAAVRDEVTRSEGGQIGGPVEPEQEPECSDIWINPLAFL